MAGGRIIGWGTALPEKVLTNHDLSAMMDTNDEWITERTGIKQRHIGGSTASLSVASARRAIAMAGIDPASIDGLVLSTTTPDRTVPATSATVQNELGLRCGAFDVNAACSGFVYAYVVAQGLLAIGAKRLLVIGTDTLSRITDWSDRGTAILFADGSGACIVDSTPDAGQLLGWDLDADGSLEHLLYAEVGGYIHMDGKEVFRRAVRIMIDSAKKSLAKAGLSVDDVKLCVPHQANLRIIDATAQRMGLNPDKVMINIERYGNTTAATIPLCLWEWEKQLKKGDNIILASFGAGFTWGSIYLKWGYNGK